MELLIYEYENVIMKVINCGESIYVKLWW